VDYYETNKFHRNVVNLVNRTIYCCCQWLAC